MGKPANPRTLADSQARAVGRNIRISPRKLNLVAQSIRGKSAEAALVTLSFSQKRIARDVKKILQSAIANAENNHDLDADDLVVSEASVGRNFVMKRFHARARGRGARIEKPFAQVTIVVEEKRESAAVDRKRQGRTTRPPRQSSETEAAKKVPGKRNAGTRGKVTKAGAAQARRKKERV